MVIPPHDSRESIAGPRVFGARVAASLARAAVDAPRRSAARVFVLIVRRGLAPVGRGWRRAVVGRRRAEIAGVRRRWKCSRCGSRDVLSFAIGRGSGTGYARPLPSGSRFSLRAKRSTWRCWSTHCQASSSLLKQLTIRGGDPGVVVSTSKTRPSFLGTRAQHRTGRGHHRPRL